MREIRNIFLPGPTLEATCHNLQGWSRSRTVISGSEIKPSRQLGAVHDSWDLGVRRSSSRCNYLRTALSLQPCNKKKPSGFEVSCNKDTSSTRKLSHHGL
jgi:hypothetical protein